MKRFQVRFTGNVQGVGFRMTCLTEATGLIVHGFVRNESDGSVLMDIDTMPAIAKQLVGRICEARRGYIDNVVQDESDSLGRNDGFRIDR